MSRNKTAEWQPFETAPKDGTELIFWVSFYFSKGQWWWADTEDVLKRPDLVNGWMLYPQPPTLARKKNRSPNT